MSEETVPTCDECDREATQGAQDLKEGDPVEGPDGKIWATWEPFFDVRWGCEEHPVESVEYDKKGRPKSVSDQEKLAKRRAKLGLYDQ